MIPNYATMLAENKRAQLIFAFGRRVPVRLTTTRYDIVGTIGGINHEDGSSYSFTIRFDIIDEAGGGLGGGDLGDSHCLLIRHFHFDCRVDSNKVEINPEGDSED